MKKEASKSSAKRQKEYRERAKQLGMRKVQCWAPDDYSRQLLLDIAAYLRSRKMAEN